MIGIILGFVVGTFFGVSLICCLNVAKEADREIENLEHSRKADEN